MSAAERVDPAQLARDVAELWTSLPRAAEFLEIKTKDGQLVPFTRSRWWREQIRFEKGRSGRDIVIKPRQIGFSTIEILRDYVHAVSREGAGVQIVAHEQKPVLALFDAVKIAHESARRWGIAPSAKANNVRELSFARLHSRISVTEAGSSTRTAQGKGRSGSISRLHATEVAYWHQPAETWRALEGALTPDAEVVIESTPNGAGGMFYTLVTAAAQGRGPYRLHFYPWFEHAEYRATPPDNFDPAPRDRWETKLRALGVDDAQIAWWRSKVDNPAFGLEAALAEYPIDVESAFRAPGGAYIPPAAIDWLTSTTRKPVEVLPDFHGAPLRIFGRVRSDDEAIIGGDVAEGLGRDECALVVISRKTGAVLATWSSDSIEPGDFGHVMAKVGKLYSGRDGPALLAPERNNAGSATLRALTHEAKYPARRIYEHEDGRDGWPTNTATRPVLFDELRRAIVEGSAPSACAALAAQAKTLIKGEKNKPQALNKESDDGCKDDLFVAWGIAWQVRERPSAVPASGRVKGI